MPKADETPTPEPSEAQARPRIVLEFQGVDSPDAHVMFQGVSPLQAYAAVWLLSQAASDYREAMRKRAEATGLVIPGLHVLADPSRQS